MKKSKIVRQLNKQRRKVNDLETLMISLAARLEELEDQKGKTFHGGNAEFPEYTFHGSNVTFPTTDQGGVKPVLLSGTDATVTGDTEDTNHCIPVGTKVRVCSEMLTSGSYKVLVGSNHLYVGAADLVAYEDEDGEPVLTVGDRAEVTGDTAQWRHDIPDGTIVVIQDVYTSTCYGDGFTVITPSAEEWVVAAGDLKKVQQ